MEISDNTVVMIDYTLRNDDGKVLDSSAGRSPLAYLHGHGNIVAGLEKALAGNAVGAVLRVAVPPAEGYGEYQDGLEFDVAREDFQDDEVEVGMMFRARLDDGPPRVYTVEEIGEETVRVNGNHPLAGQTLNFEVTVRDVRPATPSEIQHGHVHGPGGHHH